MAQKETCELKKYLEIRNNVEEFLRTTVSAVAVPEEEPVVVQTMAVAVPEEVIPDLTCEDEWLENKNCFFPFDSILGSTQSIATVKMFQKMTILKEYQCNSVKFFVYLLKSSEFLINIHFLGFFDDLRKDVKKYKVGGRVLSLQEILKALGEPFEKVTEKDGVKQTVWVCNAVKPLNFSNETYIAGLASAFEVAFTSVKPGIKATEAISEPMFNLYKKFIANAWVELFSSSKIKNFKELFECAERMKDMRYLMPFEALILEEILNILKEHRKNLEDVLSMDQETIEMNQRESYNIGSIMELIKIRIISIYAMLECRGLNQCKIYLQSKVLQQREGESDQAFLKRKADLELVRKDII